MVYDGAQGDQRAALQRLGGIDAFVENIGCFSERHPFDKTQEQYISLQAVQPGKGPGKLIAGEAMIDGLVHILAGLVQILIDRDEGWALVRR